MASQQEEPERLTERIGGAIGWGIIIILIPFLLLCAIMLFQARMEFLFQ